MTVCLARQRQTQDNANLIRAPYSENPTRAQFLQPHNQQERPGTTIVGRSAPRLAHPLQGTRPSATAGAGLAFLSSDNVGQPLSGKAAAWGTGTAAAFCGPPRATCIVSAAFFPMAASFKWENNSAGCLSIMM
eukprot:CAMPEP_0183513086 /NCGR_PEP_ID=MMETSP0371-20130417/11979_1 /TAXON_ID=268820 /ORGANISM="Peridinium aciculiferum, Strain PAER-2" /LENGTH=132 /DNA_ID=CAMNT_0025710269 /DNA_START=48 /DNA_END=447 /DNA_ORIENTATION=+